MSKSYSKSEILILFKKCIDEFLQEMYEMSSKDEKEDIVKSKTFLEVNISIEDLLLLFISKIFLHKNGEIYSSIKKKDENIFAKVKELFTSKDEKKVDRYKDVWKNHTAANKSTIWQYINLIIDIIKKHIFIFMREMSNIEIDEDTPEEISIKHDMYKKLKIMIENGSLSLEEEKKKKERKEKKEIKEKKTKKKIVLKTISTNE